MYLTEEIKKKVDEYFNNISPDEFIHRMESLYGFEFEEIVLEVNDTYTQSGECKVGINCPYPLSDSADGATYPMAA